MTVLSLAKFLSWYGDSGSARNSSMPRETFTAPATLPLFSTSGASRTSTTRVLPLAIISRACAGVIRGTAALAASIICLTLVAMASSSRHSRPSPADALPQPQDCVEDITAGTALQRHPKSGEAEPSATLVDRAGVDRGHVFTLPQRLKTGHKFSCHGPAGVRNHALSRSSDSSAAGDDKGRDRRAGTCAAGRQQ